MAKATRGQRKTVGRVMHEWKHGELESSRGGKVRSRRQAVAIALSEAGESRKQTRGQKRRQYARTKSKERRGQTAMQQKEGRRSTTRTGRILLRPVTPIVQVLASDFQLKRVGRMLTGVLALALALPRTEIVWTVGKLVYLPIVVLSGIVLFAAIDLIGGTLCFWTIERTEVINVFTYGGVFMSSYPMNIYQAWMRRTFTFLIPIAFIGYYPGLYFLDHRDPLGLPRIVSFLTPVVAIAFAVVALAFWEWGVRHYQSTGS